MFFSFGLVDPNKNAKDRGWIVFLRLSTFILHSAPKQ